MHLPAIHLYKTWTDLVMKTTGSVNISTSPPGSPNLKGPSALSDKRKPLALERLSGTIPRARPVLHLLVELLGSADDLQLMSADYVEVPPVLDDAGNLLAPSQGGAGCLSSFSRSLASCSRSSSFSAEVFGCYLSSL
mgnify:CR=1 FL=1